MPPKIIPNKYEKLTCYILDKYNAYLKCEGCKTTWAADGTAFMKDQAGSRDNMYDRYFRCKGKGKGKCSQSYTHEDFLALATHQLGQACIERIKIECGFSLPSMLETPVPKRPHDGYPTGFTPSRKHTASTTIEGPVPHLNFSLPPVVESTIPSSLPDDRDTVSVLLSEDLANLKSIRLMRAEMMLEVLTAKLEQKEEYIKLLQERIKLMAPLQDDPESVCNTQTDLPTIGTPSVTPEPPTTQVPASYDDSIDKISSSISVNVQEESIPSTYAQVLQTPTPVQTVLRRASPIPGPNRFKVLQNRHNLGIVYFLGFRQSKVGEFRKTIKQMGLPVQFIHNVSFVGNSIVEILVEASSVQAFVDKAKSVGYIVRIDLDITSKSTLNPIVLEYPNSSTSIPNLVKSNFIRRVSHEIKTCSDDRVKQYYLDWAEMLEWKDSLLVASTLSVSP